MPGVFISYRWEDKPANPPRNAVVDRLYAHLRLKLGKKMVFRDKYSVKDGENLTRGIHGGASHCDVMFVVIGSDWLDILRKHQKKGKDLLQEEIAIALERGIRVVPLLVDEPRRLREKDLPRKIAVLASHKYIKVNTNHEGSSFRGIAKIAKECVADGRELIGRVREVLSDFVPDRNCVAGCPGRHFEFVAKKDSPRVDFKIYVAFKNRFMIPRSTVLKWIQDNRYSPVLMLCMDQEPPKSPARPSFGFLILSDWLQNNPALLMQRKSVRFTLRNQRCTPESIQRLTAALKAEYAVVTGTWLETRAPLRMAPSDKLPIGQPELFLGIGRLARLEPPVAVLRNKALGRSADERFHRERELIQKALSDDPETRQEALEIAPAEAHPWLNSIIRTPNQSEITQEAKALRQFFRAVNVLNGKTDALPVFPPFRWKEVSTWRIAFQLFPIAGLALLQKFYDGFPKIWKHEPELLVSSLLLTSPLAIRAGGDPEISGPAQDLLTRVGRFVDSGAADGSWPDYFVRVSYYAVCAEAHRRNALTRFRNYSERREVESWDLAMMRYYYQDDDAHSAAVVRTKVYHPTLRLQYTKEHEIWRAELLRKRGAPI
jgi:TIR domain